MEAKNKATTGIAPATKSSGFNLFAFFGSVKSEFKKITWTDKEELKVYTKIVVAATFIVGMAIYATDLVVRTALSGLHFILEKLVSLVAS